MITAASIAVVIALALGLCVAAMRLPTWFFRSLHRDAQWQLRDEVADQVLLGNLAADHPAVRSLLCRMERQARQGTELNIVAAWLTCRRFQLDGVELEALRSPLPSLSGLPETQRRLVDELNRRCLCLAWGSVMLSSWPGLWLTLLAVPEALRRKESVLQGAAFEAAVRSPGISLLAKSGIEPDALTAR